MNQKKMTYRNKGALARIALNNWKTDLSDWKEQQKG